MVIIAHCLYGLLNDDYVYYWTLHFLFHNFFSPVIFYFCTFLRSVKSVPLVLQIPGLVNVDFADVKAVMKNSGTAMLGIGVSSSKNRAEEAAEQATLAPLIGSSIQSATGVVYNITGGKDITLQEVNRVSQVLYYLFNF